MYIKNRQVELATVVATRLINGARNECLVACVFNENVASNRRFAKTQVRR